jgi:hypothetical protein
MGLASVKVDGSTLQSAGAVAQISSRGGLLDPTGHRFFYQGAPGVAGTATEWEEFGATLPGSGYYND